MVVVVVVGRRRQVLSLQHGHEALVDTDVLLLRLDHPHPLTAHGVYHAEDVDILRVTRQLQHMTRSLYSLQSGPRARLSSSQ